MKHEPPSVAQSPGDESLPSAEWERHRDRLLAIARVALPRRLRQKIDASDVVQQTLLQAWNGRAEFRGRADAERAAWLQRILANVVADRTRQFHTAKRDFGLEQPLDGALESSALWLTSVIGASAERNEAWLKLSQALADLPPEQAEAIRLHHILGRPVGEVAKVMARTEASVAGLLRRGLRSLRRQLDEQET